MARAQNPLGEELIIFGNPTRIVASRKEADKARAELEAQGYQVSVHAMHGGTYTVLGMKKPGKNGIARLIGRKTRNPKRRRRNEEETAPEDRSSEAEQAVTLFEKFHGKAPAETLELQRSAAMRLDYTALGDLRAIGIGEAEYHGNDLVQHWEELPFLDFADNAVKLASAPNGRQLYLIGGTQDVTDTLGDFEGVDPEKDLIDLGVAGFVVYDARKKHSNFEPIEWVHELGEKGGELPRIMYDRLKQELFFVGGEYFIDLAPELSQGIEN
jgi:hypothetical protein